MVRAFVARLRRLGALFALLVAVFAVAPMAQAVCICDAEIAAAVDDGAAISASDQDAGEENCVCAACHCCHIGGGAPSAFTAVSLAMFAVEQAAPLNDARLLPLPPNALERPPRG